MARSTKSTWSLALPLLVGIGFQVLFHSPPGVLFTFPSRYYALSVTKEYLALGGGPPCFPQGSSCLVVLWIRTSIARFSLTGLSPSMVDLSRSLLLSSLYLASYPQPRTIPSTVWAPSLSLATTQEIDFSFSSSGYLDVSVPLVSLPLPIYSVKGIQVLPWMGSPIRISPDLRPLAAPRSFSQLATSFLGSWCLGIHPMPLVA